MEINYRFTDFLWLDDEKWCVTININGSADAFELEIKDETFNITTDYEGSFFSKEKLDDILKRALRDKNFLQTIKKTIKFVKCFEDFLKTDNYMNLEIEKLTYQKKENWEDIRFVFKDFPIEFHHSEDLSGVYGYESMAYIYPNEKNSYIREIEQYMRESAYKEMLKKVYSHPKVRLKKMLL